MRTHIYKIKQDMKNIAGKIKELKKVKLSYDQLNYSYPNGGLGYAKKWRNLRNPGRISFKDSWIIIDNTTFITDEMVTMQDERNTLYWKCIGELHKLQYEYRLLSIVYGHFRGKTREQMEPKFNLRDTTINPLTKKYVSGKDPIDWVYIQELKKHYLEPIAEGD